jgi:AbrB family looped-hinge helix DNA binding protein
MEVTLDKYGRIVIPKPVRERLGLEAGSSLELGVEPVEGGGEAIALRPAGQAPVLQRKGHVLVHTGTADRPLDPVEAIQRSRQERIRKLAGNLAPDESRPDRPDRS